MPYTFEDASLQVSAEPQIRDGVTWVPLRSLAQSMGANVDWDPDNRIAILYPDQYRLLQQLYPSQEQQ